MPYCTEADIKKLLPESMLINLTNDTAGATTIDAVNLGEAIDQADREIDSYVSIAGYAVPFVVVPPLIANLSVKMAIWNLHLRKYFNSEIWEKTYKSCLRLLERISQGKQKIAPEVDGTVTGASGGYACSSRTQELDQTLWDTF
jgi:phage gp36-like protein